jgi:hypothetical protein
MLAYSAVMNPKWLLVWCGIALVLSGPESRADQLELQNGDHFSGKVLSVSADAVVLQSDVLGKVTLPRSRVARLAFGTNSFAPAIVSPGPASTNLPTAAALVMPLKTNASLVATPPALAGDTNVIRQIREQMLGGSPGAAAKYDEMVSGLLSGKMDMAELHREAQSSANQIRDLKRELGPEADDALDGYLKILDAFVKESANEPANSRPQQKIPAP